MLEMRGYSELQPIHTSANSQVYSAVRQRDGKKVAIKTLPPNQVTPRRIASFHREFNVLQKYNLPCCPKAIEFVETGRSMALVLDYVEAAALRSSVEYSPLALNQFHPLAMSVLQHLGVLHRKGLIHCDLSSGNVLYNPEKREVWIIDFGSALEFPRQTKAINPPKHAVGSPHFMSPEQSGRVNRGLDYRTDFYSLGALYYLLLTGHLPHEVNDPNELVHCHIAVEPITPVERVEAIPVALSGLVMKLLSKDAADRYQSIEGILSDLERCCSLPAGSKEAIELGTNDFSDRFLLSEKLYGRQKEVESLNAAYRAASKGNGSMVMVAGHSGVGKTSLVTELNKSLAESGGHIISGKCDQYRQHHPYRVVTKALTELIRHILGEGDEEIVRWKNSITEKIGLNGRLLTDIMPDLELLIGPQPPLEELPVVESQTRFTAVFQSFMECFDELDKPIIIFLDDLQWIDHASLGLLMSFNTIVQTKRVLIIGAYRDNEVGDAHMLSISLFELKKTDRQPKTIIVEELTEHDIVDFLADTLHRAREDVEELGGIVFMKTGGNPLFLRTMLEILYSDGHIVFDYDARHWSWKRERLLAMPYAENVVDMLQDQIGKMGGEKGAHLGLCACLGSVFRLDHFAFLIEGTRSEAARLLKRPIKERYLLPDSAEFELWCIPEADEMCDISISFTHDRIQQAAYGLIDEERRSQLHYQFGYKLLSDLGQKERGSQFLMAVNNLNLGVSLMGEREMQEQVTRNLQAAAQAKESAAFSEAHSFLDFGRGLLDEKCWQTNHEVAVQLYTELAEACYLIKQFEQANEYYRLIREKAESSSDVQALINIQAKQYHHQGRYAEAIELELEGLKLLGIDLPDGDEELFGIFQKESAVISSILGDKDGDSLTKLPEISDPELTRTHELLFDLFADGYLMGRGALLACAAAISTRLSLERGVSPMTSIGFVNYGTCLCAGGGYGEGQIFGHAAVALSDRYQVAALKNYTYHLFALSINHWQAPLSTSYGYWREASKLAVESGSPYAGWVFLQLAHVLLASGASLDKVEEQIDESRKYLTQAGLHDIAFMLELIVGQPVKHLQGKTKDISTLDSEGFSCQELMEQYKEALFFLSHIPYSMLRASLIGRDYQSLETMSSWMDMFSQTMQGQFIHVDCYYYFTLHLTGGYRQQSVEEQSLWLKGIDENVERFEAWAKLCPDNYEHKYKLIAAERTAITGDTLAALDLYDQAIEGAYKGAFLQDAAIANERAGIFWEECGKQQLAASYLEQAMIAYGRWGATGKVAWMRRMYPELVRRTIHEKSAVDTFSSLTGTDNFSAQLDLSSIIRASQAVSQHVTLDKLAAELIYLAKQNAGATKAIMLVRKSNSDDLIKVEPWLDHSPEERGDVTLQTDAPSPPEHVINFVVRSGESLVVDDTSEDNWFKQKYPESITAAGVKLPKSICCIPIINRNEVRAVLYLENSHMTYTFHTDRLRVLKAIASQTAISLENIDFYNKIDGINKELESKVLERTRELDLKNRELEILSVTDQLTGLYNRRHIDCILKKEVQRCHRYNNNFSIILSDIDDFKRVNDTYGHDVGDDVLIAVAKAMQDNSRDNDVVGRFGGEEFIILIPQADEEMCRSMAEKLRRTISELDLEHVGSITASFGVAQCLEGDNISDLIKNADEALYCAKRGGRNRVVAASDPAE